MIDTGILDCMLNAEKDSQLKRSMRASLTDRMSYYSFSILRQNGMENTNFINGVHRKLYDSSD